MAILVTGGAGFIGSHLVQGLLAQGESIVIIDNFNDYYDPEIKRGNIEIIRKADKGGLVTLAEGDIRDRELVMSLFAEHQFSTVYHLAAMAGVRYSIEYPAYYFDVNIGGSINLLDAAVLHGKPKFVAASSSSVYGGSPHIPFSESDPVNAPVSPYAASKKAAELLAHTYYHLHGLDISSLRFFTVYGPRQRPEMAIHLFARKILDGEELPMFGDGSSSRDYTYIDDIVAGIIASGKHCQGYNIYNLGNSHPVKLADLIDRISAALGKTAKIKQLPMPAGDVLRTWADISQAEKDLGYKPLTNLDEGLAKFVTWLVEGLDSH
jgi:UDP-glucuronate 4-epimerase